MELRFIIDLLGVLWRGPVNPAGSRHWERFDGFGADGSELWTLDREQPPLSGSRIPAAQAQRIIEGTRK